MTTETEELFIKNQANFRLSTVIHRPASGGKHPAVLVLHGFTGFKDEEHIKGFAEKLAECGFVAVRFDTMGFGDSDGNHENDFRVTNYLADIQTMLDYIVKLPEVDPGKVGICGHSLGGGLSIFVSANNPLIKACCAVQPSAIKMDRGVTYNLEEWKTSGWYKKTGDHPKHKSISLPWEFAVDRNRYDALTAAKQVSIPFMLMYGTADLSVKPEICLALYENVPDQKELVTLENYGHDFKNYPDQLKAVANKLVDFFKRMLMP